MKRLFIIFAAFALATSAWAAVASLKVGTGTEENTLAAGDAYITGDTEVDGVLLLDAIAIPADDVTPDVAGGNIAVTGVNTVPTAITDLDNPIPGATYTLICGDVANASTIADAGNFTLADAWAPATIGDSIVLYCFADNDYRELSRTYVAAAGGPVIGDPFLAGPGAVGAPAYSYQADPDSGRYWVGANSFADAVGGVQQVLYDGTGITVTGINGPIGTVTPAAGTFTNVDVGGTFNFGQDPADLVNGYKEIGTYISGTVDGFDHGSDAHLAVVWDTTNVVGLGTNTVTGLDGWNQLITGGGGGPDMESTRSNGLHVNAAYAPRLEGVVDLGAIAAGQTFYFGFWAAANRYAEIIHEPATSANWLLRVDDTAGAETIDSGVAATVNPTKLEISVTAGGVVDWAIDDVDMATAGLTNLMANDHYIEWRILDVAAAAHTINMDYVILEQLKQQ